MLSGPGRPVAVRDQPVTSRQRQDGRPTTKCRALLPPFGSGTGRLPEGEHVVSWDELVDRFARTPRRRQLLDGLAETNELLAEAGYTRIWLNGSFVTAKDEPADFNAC